MSKINITHKQAPKTFDSKSAEKMGDQYEIHCGANGARNVIVRPSRKSQKVFSFFSPFTEEFFKGQKSLYAQFEKELKAAQRKCGGCTGEVYRKYRDLVVKACEQQGVELE